MFAARIIHPLVPGALTERRAEYDAAQAVWSAHLAAMPGFRSFVVLAEPDGNRITALSLWESAEAFQAAFAHPGTPGAAAGLQAFFAAPALPEFPAVIAAT